jgi:hypothetical protein
VPARSKLPIAASIIFHAVVLYAVSRGSWRAEDSDDRERPPIVLWLTEVPMRVDADADLRRPPPDEPPRSDDAPPGVVDEQRAPDASDPPLAPVAPRSARDERDPSDDERADSAEAATAPRRVIVEARIDWEREARRVVESAREQRERDARYRTFSLNDVVPGSPRGEPGRRKSVFDSPAAGRAGLSYQDASGATVRWISDACYSVSGGVGNLFAFPLSVAAADLPNVTCVRLIPRSDLFEHVKPGYLLPRPPEPASVHELRD